MQNRTYLVLRHERGFEGAAVCDPSVHSSVEVGESQQESGMGKTIAGSKAFHLTKGNTNVQCIRDGLIGLLRSAYIEPILTIIVLRPGRPVMSVDTS